MRSLIFPSEFMLNLSPDPTVAVMGHYPVASSLAELEESRVASSQGSSQECAHAFVQRSALIPCWACVSWPLVPVLILWQHER